MNTTNSDCLAVAEPQSRLAGYELSSAAKRRRLNASAHCAGMSPGSGGAISSSDNGPIHVSAAFASSQSLFRPDDTTTASESSDHISTVNASISALAIDSVYNILPTCARVTLPSFRQVLESCNLTQPLPLPPTPPRLSPHLHFATGQRGWSVVPNSVHSPVRSLSAVAQISAEERSEVSCWHGHVMIIY